MFRVVLLVILVVAAVVSVDSSWDEQTRAVTLRLRDGEEVAILLRRRALSLGESAIQAARGTGEAERAAADPATRRPPVGAGGEASSDGLTREDREALDRLIEEKLRETPRAAPTGAN